MDHRLRDKGDETSGEFVWLYMSSSHDLYLYTRKSLPQLSYVIISANHTTVT